MMAHNVYKMRQITDGTSTTYMLGEKSVNPRYYIDPGPDTLGDDQGPFIADERDSARYTNLANYPISDSEATKEDRDPNFDITWRFGSAHSGGLLMAFCDGSVHTVSFSIDPKIHLSLGARNDGIIVDKADVY